MLVYQIKTIAKTGISQTKNPSNAEIFCLAEREGFEPSRRV